ncbi:hypothetical protein TNCV_972711 [Trichonephila clavipes]|nr:hypothetical protein TNCV_972711 [Trichonephila clavipes]
MISSARRLLLAYVGTTTTPQTWDFDTGNIVWVGRYLSHCSCKDDDNAANKTYESRILETESSSDESDEEKHGNI